MYLKDFFSHEKDLMKNIFIDKSLTSYKINTRKHLSLQVKISNLAAETKCFKYWKNEKQSSPEITISEFADCLMITLCFCDLADIEDLTIMENDNKNMVELFLQTHKLVSTLTKDLDKETLLKILSNLLTIGKLLNYTDKELYEFCLNKMNKTLEMISK